MSIKGFKFRNVPEELIALPYWLIWRFKTRQEGGKPTKVPCSIKTGSATSVKDLAHLGSFEEALAACERHNASGIGFSFIEGCGIVGLDFDDCINSEQELCPRVAELVERLGYAEVSPSQRGIKVFVKADLDFSGANRLKNFPSEGVEIEMYNANRFFTVTGDKLDELSIEPLKDRTLRVDGIHSQVRSAKNLKSDHIEPESGESELEDESVLEIACSAKNGAKFRDLYEGIWEKHFESQSEADMSFCMQLAFYCNRDNQQIDRVFRKSALYRPKWDEKRGLRTYGERTVRNAIARTAQVYQEAPPIKDSWEEPIPFDEWHTPTWPKGLMPQALEAYTDAVSEYNQTPAAQAKMMSFAVLAAAAQRSYYVKVDEGGRSENLALFVCSVAKSGERKSADLRLLLSAFKRFEKESRQATKIQAASHEATRSFLQAQLSKTEREAIKSEDPYEKLAEVQNISQELASLDEISPKRLFTQDVTPEELARLMWANEGSMALFSAEGGPLDNIKSKYKRNPKVEDVYTQGFSGDDVRVDRKGSEPIILDDASLTMGIMTQPSHLKGFLADPEFGGRGILARFLWCVPKSLVGWRRQGKPLPRGLKENYESVISSILPQPGWSNPGSAPERRALVLCPEGREALAQFFEELEIQQRDGNRLASEALGAWCSRLHTAAVKISALWHIYDFTAKKLPVPTQIEARWLNNAIHWIKSFAIPMGLKAFGLLGMDLGTEMAKRMLSRIGGNHPEEFTKSEFRKWHFNNNTSKKELDAGYSTLVELGYLRQQRIETGGRPRTVYRLNPRVLSRQRKGPADERFSVSRGVSEDQIQCDDQNRVTSAKICPAIPGGKARAEMCIVPDSDSASTPCKKGEKGEKWVEQQLESLLTPTP